MKLLSIVVVPVVVPVVVAIVVVALGLWWALRSDDSKLDRTSGTDYILAWKQRTTIDTRLGTVSGLSNGRVHAFLGMPYAQPPTADSRFLPPVAVALSNAVT